MAAAVIFDMDGVLVDSYDTHYQAWEAMAADEGLDFDPKAFIALFGRTSREVVAGLWGEGRYTDAEIAALDDRREAAYRTVIQAQFPAMPGALELIQSLRSDGFALALGSSGPPENAALVLDLLGVRQFFKVIVTGQDVRRGKPDPEVFLIAASLLGVPPHYCAVIDDAPAGIAAANAGGMVSIGVASTGRTHQSLSSAHLVVDSLNAISPMLIRRLLDDLQRVEESS